MIEKLQISKKSYWVLKQKFDRINKSNKWCLKIIEEKILEHFYIELNQTKEILSDKKRSIKIIVKGNLFSYF